MKRATKTYLDLTSVSEFTRFVKLIPIRLSVLILAANFIFSFGDDDVRINEETDLIPTIIMSSDVVLDSIAMKKPEPLVINVLKDSRTMDEKIFCWCQQIGSEFNVDPYLIRAVIRVESHDDPDICGNGALGLMQIIPSCHRMTMETYGYSIEDLFDPYKNIRVGTAYLSNLIHKYKDISYSLVCYNKGEGGARDYGKNTSTYSEHVLSVYNELKGGDIL